MTRSLSLHAATVLLLSVQSTPVSASKASLELAFVHPRNRANRIRASPHRYYISDPTAAADLSQDANSNFNDPKNQNSKKHEVNEWGIPHHSTLEPLGPVTGKVPDRLPNGGRVTLVGSGPGDPELLTLAAYRLLTENPDALVISDRLVSQEILDLIPGEVKIARKLPGCQELAQEEIFSWVHEGLKQGKHVIRLKIGDPFVFGRGGEEVLVFRDFGLEAKVIPVRK